MPELINPTTYEVELLGKDKVEIGDRKSVDFKPHIKLNRWDGECFIKVGLPTTEKVSPVIEADKVKFKGSDIEAHFYGLEQTTVIAKDKDGKDSEFIQNELGGFEFEVILRKKPVSNKIVLDIETEGLKFYYQPELTPEEIDEGCVRPDNVVGSYAVYHATRTSFHKGKADAEKYKCGKAFHIYRPKITDVEGKWIWGELSLDEQAGTLTTTIPQGFLDSAVYPVSTGTTNFGCEEVGGTDYDASEDKLAGLAASSGGSGNAQSIAFYIHTDTYDDGPRKYGLYRASDGVFLEGTAEYSGETPDNWVAHDLLSQPEITDQDYWIIHWGEEHALRYDVVADIGRYAIIDYPGTWPSPWSASSFSYKLSCYCTYEEAAIDVTVEPPLATVDSAGQVPTLSLGSTLLPPLATVDGVGLVPTFSLGRIFGAPLATVDVAGFVPVIRVDRIFDAPLATVDVAGLAPEILIVTLILPPLATIDAAGLAPTLSLDRIFSAPLATVAGVGLVPTLSLDRIFAAPLAAISAAGLVPILSLGITLLPPVAATIAVAGLAPTVVIPLVYSVKIDWNGDGDFGDAEENISAVVFGLSVDRGRDQAWELGKSKASVAEVLADNAGRKYSPENTESPIYGSVKPVRPIRIVALEHGVTYPLFLGYLEDFSLDPAKDKREVLFYAEDGLTRMRTQKLYTPVYEDIATGAAVGHVLDAIGWPEGKRSIDAGQTTMLYWWAWDKSALASIRELEETELGLFYVSEDGTATFEDRHHRLKGAHLVSQATYGPDNRIYHGFKYDARAKDIFNHALVTVKRYSEGSVTVLWTLDEEPVLAPGEVRTWRALFAGPAVDLVTPQATTDYRAYSVTGGAGDDLTADIDVSVTKMSRGSDLEVENTGSVPAYLYLLQQRGKLLATAQSSYEADNAASQADYGKRTFPIPGALLPTEAVGKDFCDYAVSRYGEHVPRVRLAIWNATESDLAELLARRVSDRVTVKNPELGLDDDFFVHGLRHTVSDQGKLHRLELIMEKAVSEQYWVLGEEGLSELGETTYLAF